MANGNPLEGPKRPTFEPPPNLHAELLEMDIDLGKDTAPFRASTPWLSGKCIPQASQALKYVISSPRIEEQKQYMRDYALVGKFLGLSPSERDLVK
jgi:hypothetical protein